ncbi:hypothetical protein NPIL_66911 [Nephila pilipes]|uniref:Uncharacterized protein n=1 Tax=Nephila pilipes TaxID=299642 RepID=A0A8X6MUR6_NEPPI|nr:hypothetical protein NPIL_66911 [Nephila pilipes]
MHRYAFVTQRTDGPHCKSRPSGGAAEAKTFRRFVGVEGGGPTDRNPHPVSFLLANRKSEGEIIISYLSLFLLGCAWAPSAALPAAGAPAERDVIFFSVLLLLQLPHT